MRYFLELNYNGSAYFGWQRQNGQQSVQQTLEESLSTLLRAPIPVTGAGRTDTGVHASYYVAHFDCNTLIADPRQTVYKVNRILPHDISVWSLKEVAPEAHARFNALEREYHYYIEPGKNPFNRPLSWQFAQSLDIERMNRAAEILLEVEDFTTFAKLNSNNKTNICHLSRAEWEVLPDGEIRFTIRADRFLRNMVRAIVGTLVDVGRGRYTEDEFRDIVLSKDLSRSSGGAPASGLFLVDVTYPDDIFRASVPRDKRYR